MGHHEDDWDMGVVELIIGEGRGWVLLMTTLIVIGLLVWHHYY